MPLWFAQVETAFRLQCITDTFVQFHVVTGALSPEVASEIRKLIITPPTVEPFKKLKEELKQRYGLTSRE